MERKKCNNCANLVLYLETHNHIQFGGTPPPVQKDGLCPKCWCKLHKNEPTPSLPGWHYALKVAKK